MAVRENSRERVLTALRASPEGLDADELGHRVGLHPNTVRWHLGVLAEEGAIRSAPQPRTEPGRPRIVYYAQAEGRGREDYRLLATILASLLAQEPDAAGRAEAAGRAWGRYLVDRPAPFSRVTPREAREQLLRLLEDNGFAPTAEGDTICMNRCPFHELAVTHGNVVCSLHLGLLRGALEEVGGATEILALEPFVEPSLCIARLG